MSKGFTLDFTSDLKFEASVTQQLCVIVDTPRSLAVYLLVKYHEWEQLVELSIDPSNYEDHRNFADDYLVTEILQKSANLPLKIDRQEVAMKSFWDSEHQCKNVNDNFSLSSTFPGISRVSILIQKMLGPLGVDELNFISEHFRFGPGATTGVTGRGCVLSDKYDAEMHLTLELIPFYKAILGERWWEHQSHPTIVAGSKFTTVPKNAKTDRGIAIEPTLNIYGQLGIGALLRKRLMRFGINLNSQERNQYLASIASTESLATIDLKAASDTISFKIVQTLLPECWFHLLDLFRSSEILIDGNFHELEKFSSMGNGFTFELESLIFAAVAFTYVPKELHPFVSVYGDDIIVPQAYAEDVINALESLGFSVNTKKSFLAGKFFESCGTDWFDNQNVRPFYLRRKKDAKIPYSVQVANALRIYANRRGYGEYCDPRFRSLWLALYKASPKEWRQCKVPEHVGDSGFIVSYDEARAPRARHFIDGWMVNTVQFRPITRRKASFGLLLAMLARRGMIENFTYGREPKRGFLGKPRTKKVLVEHWTYGYCWGL